MDNHSLISFKMKLTVNVAHNTCYLIRPMKKQRFHEAYSDPTVNAYFISQTNR